MRKLLALLLVTACGDDGNKAPIDTPPMQVCAPPQAPLPGEGMIRTAAELPLTGCVEHGLTDLAGRWFVVDPMSGFTFSYPRFDGSCEAGFHRSLTPTDDHDASDGDSVHTWSDGTTFFDRQRFAFQTPMGEFEFVFAFATCMTADGTLAARSASFDTDRGLRMSNPQKGTRFGAKEPEVAKGLQLVGELGTFGQAGRVQGLNLVVDGNTAYVAGFNGLDIIDVTTKSAPKHLAHFDGDFNDVRVVRGGGKTVAYGADRNEDRVAIFDVTNPAAPVEATPLAVYAHSLQVRGTDLFLGDYTASVPRYDITNPLTPVLASVYPVPGPQAGVHDLTVDGNWIYANNTTEGFVAYQMTGTQKKSTPAPYSHASWVATVNGKRLVLHGDEGMTHTPELGTYLRILDGDTTASTFLTDIGKYQSRPQVGIHNFEVVGNKAYIAYYQDGVRIVDLTNPAQPVEVAHYNTWDPVNAPGTAFEGALGIRVVGGYIYVADDVRGLLILQEQ